MRTCTQYRCLFTGEGIKKIQYICTVVYYLATNKSETLFKIEPENIMLSEIR
jgi:hypothetical protein